MISSLAAARRARLGGREVHLIERGGAGPVVVLIGGCGVPSYQWEQVMAELPGRAVVALDRPGLLGTPWPGRLPSLAEEVATLRDLVAEQDGPVVLVGHSMGGPHAEAYVRLHPDQVIGLVLVDGSVDWQPRPPRPDRRWLAISRTARRLTATRPLGGLAALGSFGDRLLVSRQSRHGLTEHRGAATATFRDPEAIASVLAEQAAYGAQLWDLAQLRGRTTWPQIGVRVLAATARPRVENLSAQRRLARSLGGRLVEVPQSRHLMMLDAPDQVVAAIEELAPADL